MNPLTGWCSSRDPYANLVLHFDTAEDAMNYCERHGMKYFVYPLDTLSFSGMDYIVRPTDEFKPRVKKYSDNFKYNPPKKALWDS